MEAPTIASRIGDAVPRLTWLLYPDIYRRCDSRPHRLLRAIPRGLGLHFHIANPAGCQLVRQT